MASNYETTTKFPAIAFEGYSYRFDKFVSGHTKKRWRCRTRDCNGCLYTSSGIGNSDSQRMQVKTATNQNGHTPKRPQTKTI